LTFFLYLELYLLLFSFLKLANIWQEQVKIFNAIDFSNFATFIEIVIDFS